MDCSDLAVLFMKGTEVPCLAQVKVRMDITWLQFNNLQTSVLLPITLLLKPSLHQLPKIGYPVLAKFDLLLTLNLDTKCDTHLTPH